MSNIENYWYVRTFVRISFLYVLLSQDQIFAFKMVQQYRENIWHNVDWIRAERQQCQDPWT